jgi:hypothetical protein
MSGGAPTAVSESKVTLRLFANCCVWKTQDDVMQIDHDPVSS